VAELGCRGLWPGVQGRLAGPGEPEAAIRPPIERLLHTVCDKLGVSMTY
jgi:hypothetical protein